MRKNAPQGQETSRNKKSKHQAQHAAHALDMLINQIAKFCMVYEGPYHVARQISIDTYELFD